MTLRRTLVLLQISLVALGLLVFGVTSYQLYRHSEEARIHAELTGTAVQNLEGALCTVGTSLPCPDGFPGSRGFPNHLQGTAVRNACGNTIDPSGYNNLPGGSFAELRSSSGALLAQLRIPFASDRATATICPKPAAFPKVFPDHTFTVKAQQGPGPFLVEASPLAVLNQGQPGFTSPSTSVSPELVGAVLVVGVPLNTLHQSLHRLLTVDLVVGAVLLLALGVGSFLLIRRSLRPLERMAATSRAISAGDLSRRISAADERSEVGQLGTAVNDMLTRIEGAFAERDATEQRLRQFLADASHELRTPLTSIRGYAELWRLDPRQAGAGGQDRSGLDPGEAMARIEEHARRMGEMIEELLLLARLDELHPNHELPVDLAILAAEACDDAAALDPGRPVSLDAGEDVAVLGDIAHLRRAISNLVTNAVRHTPSGTRVEVAVGRGDGVALVSVRDHGPGLSEEGLVHAFDRFWQADASRATGGTGLGLAIVAGVAAEHGGAATIANHPDGGAVVTLRLPVPLPLGDEVSHDGDTGVFTASPSS